MYAYSWTFPLPQAYQYAFSWATPPPFKRMYFMDDPMVQLFETKLSETLCETAVWDNIWTLYIKGENLKLGHIILEQKMDQLCQR